MQQLLAFDTWLFYLINHLPHGWFLDGFFGLISGLGDSGFVWFVIGIWLVIREEKRDKRFFLPLGIAGVASWFISEILLKLFVVRLRPSNVLDNVHVIGFPNGYSFPSTHTTLAFALAVVLSYKEPRYRPYFFGLAILVAFSRTYLGYHYPGDVLAGLFLGWLIGVCVLCWYKTFRTSKTNVLSRKRKKRRVTHHRPQSAKR